MVRTASALGLAALVALGIAAPAHAVTITDFPIEPGAPALHNIPYFIITGTDGLLWVNDAGPAKAIWRFTPDGDRLPKIARTKQPIDLVATPDGSVYWTEAAPSDGDRWVRRKPDGTIEDMSAEIKYDDGDPYAADVDSTGTPVWTEESGTTNPPHQTWLCRGFEKNALPHGPSDFCPAHLQTSGRARFTDVTEGASGVLWLTDYEESKILRWTGTPTFTVFDLPAGVGPYRITRGPDGNMWATAYLDHALYRIAPNGSFKRFPIRPGSGPNDIVAGPDGALWFTEYDGNAIGRMTTDGTLTNEIPVPTPNSTPWGINVGPDGAIWFTESTGGKVGRVVLDNPQAGGGGGGGGGGAGAVSDRFAPRFDRRLGMTHRRFRVGRTPTPAFARKLVTPVGSAFAFSLSEPATVTITIARAAAGRKVGRSCRAPNRGNRSRPRCVRYVTAATLRRRARGGPNLVSFTGRVGRSTLALGSYRATAKAKDTAGNSSRPSTSTFSVVAG